jgi:hypothetical protein
MMGFLAVVRRARAMRSVRMGFGCEFLWEFYEGFMVFCFASFRFIMMVFYF